MTAPEPPPPPTQPRNPLHGLTLEAIVTALVAHYGWAGLGERVPVRCFTSDPSVASSLKFLRKTPWARARVEGLYLFMLREARRGLWARVVSAGRERGLWARVVGAGVHCYYFDS